MSQLGVNIDHIATIRQARGTTYPDLLEAARIAEEAGAVGITIHLREDRRHIQDTDVRKLRKTVTTKLNLEMAIAPDIIQIACVVHPDEVCLVPEKRQELTTEGGLDVLKGGKRLEKAVETLRSEGILVSLFIDPIPDHVQAARDLGAQMIELHTGTYANLSPSRSEKELKRIQKAAFLGQDLGLRVNAGHGLHYQNVLPIARIPGMQDLNIGHSIVARSIFTGLGQAVREMVELIRG